MTNFKYLVLLFLGIYTIHSVRTECLTEACAEKLIASIDAQYRANSNYEYDHPDDVISVNIKLRDKLLAYKTSLDKFDWENFQNPLLKRQFEILSRNWKYPETSEEFRQDTELFETVGKRKFTCSPFFHNSCKLVSYDREIKSILTNGGKPEYIKWYWREWRNHLPANVRIALKNYISYYQNLATPTKSPSAVWYENYDDPNMLEELENYMTAIRPLYQQMHGHLRQALREKFGNDIIPASGLIPHHLFEEALYQAWKKDSLLVNPYPEKKLPNLQQELNKNWGPSDLITHASHFFNMLGFPPYPSDFQNTSFPNRDESADCKPRINYHGRIQLTYCEKVNYKKLLTTHGDITRLHYAIQKNNLSVGLSKEACPGFGNALAEAIILTVSTPKHLQQHLHLLTEYNYDDEMHMNFLYRMGVHALLSLPMYFVHEKLFVDMIDKEVMPWNYNCRYWYLMEKYMGVGPSDLTHPSTYDMPPKFYTGLVDETRSTKKLFGEFLGYQIYRDLCLKAGLYQPNDSNKPLYKCDLDGNTEIGDILMKIMSAGSTNTWRKIIKDLTPNQRHQRFDTQSTMTWREIIKDMTPIKETTLHGSAFMDYYKPLLNWLTHSNEAKNVDVGWNSSDTMICLFRCSS